MLVCFIMALIIFLFQEVHYRQPKTGYVCVGLFHHGINHFSFSRGSLPAAQDRLPTEAKQG